MTDNRKCDRKLHEFMQEALKDGVTLPEEPKVPVKERDIRADKGWENSGVWEHSEFEKGPWKDGFRWGWDGALSTLTSLGWRKAGADEVVAPREPTPAMCVEGRNGGEVPIDKQGRTDVAAIYRAMITAANPTP